MANKYEQPKEGVSMDKEYSRGKTAAVPGAGLYRHPGSGKEAIVQSDPLWGNTQAQAFARLGFKFVREVMPDEIKTLPEIELDKRKEENSTLKGLSARLDKLEGVAAENESLKAEVEKLRREKAEREEADRKAAEAKKGSQNEPRSQTGAQGARSGDKQPKAPQDGRGGVPPSPRANNNNSNGGNN